MKRRLLAFLSILVLTGAAGIAWNILQISRFAGLDTDNDPLMLKEGQTPDSENVVTDDILGLGPRKGFVQFSTQTGKAHWVFNHSNGSRYLIVQDSDTLKATTGGNSFSITIGTVDSRVVTAATQLGDKWFYSNTTDGLKYWDTSTVFTATSGLKVSILATHKGRVWAAGHLSDRRTIYGSEYLNGSNFNLALNPTETDPVRIQVQGALDDNLTALFPSFKDLLIWFKGNSFGGVVGSRRSAFGSRSYSESVGCSYPESIQDCDGLLRWLGPRRTVWEFDGASYRKISEDIDTLMGTVIQGDLNQRSWTQTTSGDFNGGAVGLGLSTASSPGDVVFVSKVSAEDFWEAGSPNTPGDYTTNKAWTVDQGSFTISASGLSTNGTIDCGGGGGSFAPCESTMHTAHEIPYGYIFIDGTLPSIPSIMTYYFMAGNFLYFGGASGYAFRVQRQASGNYVYELGSVDSGGNYSTLVSSTVAQGAVVRSGLVVRRTQSGYFEMYRDADYKNPLVLTGGSAAVFIGSTTNMTFNSSAYFSMTFDPNQDPAAIPFTYNTMGPLRKLSIFGEGVSYSTFTSRSFNIGTAITSWGPFTADHTLYDGNIQYAIYGDSDASINVGQPTTFLSSRAIVPGTIPTISTAPYVVVSASFTRSGLNWANYFLQSITTQTPTLHNFSVSWNEGSTQRVASAWSNQRYWLGVNISSTSNNRALVYDRHKEWQRYSGINMDAAAIYNGSLIFCNIAGTWQAESGTTDNGLPISAYFTTKTFFPGGLDYRSYFHDLSVMSINSGETLQTQYFIDGVNSPSSLANYDMSSVLGYQNFRLPFTSSSLAQGKTISLKWSVSGSSNWRILGANLYYVKQPVPID